MKVKPPDLDEKAQIAQHLFRADPRAALGTAPIPNFTYNFKCREFLPVSQKNSGRCWIFAACNLLRIEMAELYDLPKDFELSESYVFFFDKLEKANMFLSNVLATRSLPIDSEAVRFLMASPMQDGGQFSMFMNIVNKYGIVTKRAFADTFSSENSKILNEILTSVVRSYAVKIRRAPDDGVSLRTECMKAVYNVLEICLGTPPKSFNFEFKRSTAPGTEQLGDRVCSFKGISPKRFVGEHLPPYEYCSLVNDPRNKYMKQYHIKFAGNVVGGSYGYVNTDIDRMLRYTIESLKNGHPVWFGADASDLDFMNYGVFDSRQFIFEKIFGHRIQLSKAERIRCQESGPNHAMLFTGVSLNKENKASNFRIENSWGSENAQNGFYNCTVAWFRTHVYQVIIQRRFIKHDPELASALKSDESVELQPWDPIGCLAHLKTAS